MRWRAVRPCSAAGPDQRGDRAVLSPRRAGEVPLNKPRRRSGKAAPPPGEARQRAAFGREFASAADGDDHGLPLRRGVAVGPSTWRGVAPSEPSGIAVGVVVGSWLAGSPLACCRSVRKRRGRQTHGATESLSGEGARCGGGIAHHRRPAQEGTVEASGSKNAGLPFLAGSCWPIPPALRRVTGLPMRTACGRAPCWEWTSAATGRDRIALATAAVPGGYTMSPHEASSAFSPALARRGRAVVALPADAGSAAAGRFHPRDCALGGTFDPQTATSSPEPHGSGGRRSTGRPAGSTVPGTANVRAPPHSPANDPILHAAREPEIVDLGRFLNRLGADIEGLGSSTVTIRGVDQLGGAAYRVTADRIEAATLLLAGAITGGRVSVEKIVPGDLSAVFERLDQAGMELAIGDDRCRSWPSDCRGRCGSPQRPTRISHGSSGPVHGPALPCTRPKPSCRRGLPPAISPSCRIAPPRRGRGRRGRRRGRPRSLPAFRRAGRGNRSEGGGGAGAGRPGRPGENGRQRVKPPGARLRATRPQAGRARGGHRSQGSRRHCIPNGSGVTPVD